jgi:hypothetical protein
VFPEDTHPSPAIVASVLCCYASPKLSASEAIRRPSRGAIGTADRHGGYGGSYPRAHASHVPKNGRRVSSEEHLGGARSAASGSGSWLFAVAGIFRSSRPRPVRRKSARAETAPLAAAPMTARCLWHRSSAGLMILFLCGCQSGAQLPPTPVLGATCQTLSGSCLLLTPPPSGGGCTCPGLGNGTVTGTSGS